MKTVIFACVHNAGRSQMAAAFFNEVVDPQQARAISAGSHPGERIHPEVVAVMQEAGIDLSNVRPQQLTTELAKGVSHLIEMGCGDACPVLAGTKLCHWPVSDPKGKAIEDVRQIRDEILDRVQKLVAAESVGSTGRRSTAGAR